MLVLQGVTRFSWVPRTNIAKLKLFAHMSARVITLLPSYSLHILEVVAWCCDDALGLGRKTISRIHLAPSNQSTKPLLPESLAWKWKTPGFAQKHGLPGAYFPLPCSFFWGVSWSRETGETCNCWALLLGIALAITSWRFEPLKWPWTKPKQLFNIYIYNFQRFGFPSNSDIVLYVTNRNYVSIYPSEALTLMCKDV